MSFARKYKRLSARNSHQDRTTCPKCHAKLIEKAEYGQACQECGWTKLEAKDSQGENHEFNIS